MGNKGTIVTGVLGLVLAGGLSRRMAGADKALLPVGGQPLVLRAIDRLSPQVEDLVVSANKPLAVVKDRGVTIVADCFPDNPGPLVGILSAMNWARTNRPDAKWICCVSVDTPLFPLRFVEQLANARLQKDRALIANSYDHNHPTNGLFHMDLEENLQQFLESGERKAGKWVEQIGARAVIFNADGYDPFLNVNTPADLAKVTMLDLEACSG